MITYTDTSKIQSLTKYDEIKYDIDWEEGELYAYAPDGTILAKSDNQSESEAQDEIKNEIRAYRG